MNKYDLVKILEEFAPSDTAESWDCVGSIVETLNTEVTKAMICLTPSIGVIKQAIDNNCDIIISHHPMFNVPFNKTCNTLNIPYIDIFCLHTNLDKAKGGTTDTLIDYLNLSEFKVEIPHDFVRFVELPKSISVAKFSEILSSISPNLRWINNNNYVEIKKIGFCAGSGSEFISDLELVHYDAFVTGDIKFHAAVDSNIVIYDIGHFESEILIVNSLSILLKKHIDIVIADEKSPFNYFNE